MELRVLCLSDRLNQLVSGNRHNATLSRPSNGTILDLREVRGFKLKGSGPKLKVLNCLGPVVEMTADATLLGNAIAQQEESLIGESLIDESAFVEKKDASAASESDVSRSEWPVSCQDTG